MKAPDKIYFEIDEKGKVHTYFGLQPDNATEYIRKEALLELINKKLQESADRLDYMTNKAYAEILNILNEM